ncbi:PadR family transcriptional regulator [Catenuloplanes sp. NPDC051500]|uniref:PadR family transcriptional regulator n=1 Tax=Catenuloplanes sp. NPDC051500 TaxID=3363959 RepID=UPI0037B4B08F
MSRAMHEPTFWILTAMIDAPRHGYGLIKQVVELSGGQRRLQAGTLYAALDRLVGEGLVEVDHEETIDGRPRRYYRLTRQGASALTAETARLEHTARTARRLLAAHPAFGQVSFG